MISGDLYADRVFRGVSVRSCGTMRVNFWDQIHRTFDLYKKVLTVGFVSVSNLYLHLAADM